MTTSAVSIEHFTKEYPLPRQKAKRVAVSDLSLEVPTGGIFGFLGPNGAGKTTTIKMLLGFIPATTGQAWLFDRPAEDHQARRRVGYLPEQPYFPKFLSATEVVEAHAGLSGLSGRRAKERTIGCLKLVGMYESRNLPLSKCSKGMTQRVGLASAIVGDPDLLIMDEPSSGLDPVGRKELRDLLTTLRGEGKTIFLSSHLLSEMESMCDRVGVVAKGKLVACGTPSEITRVRDSVAVQIEESERAEALRPELAHLGGSLLTGRDNGAVDILVPSSAFYHLMHLLEKKAIRLVAVRPQRESLEDAFLRLVS